MKNQESEVLDALLQRVRPIVRETLAPIEQRFLAGGSFAAVEPELRAVRKTVQAMGLAAPQLARAHGGAGLSLVTFARISEELGWNAFGHYAFNCQAPDAGNMEILATHGTPAQREAFFEPLVRGEIRSCFAMTEPDSAGSNPTQLSTTATLEGDSWVIRGKKWFTSSADGAAFAVVMAVTDPDAPPHARASQFIVPTSTPGFTLVRNIPVMGHSGDGWASHAEVTFDCRVPATALLGARQAGFAIAQERLGPGRIHHTMRWMGICERAFDLMCRRAATREIEPGVHLGDKQIVQAWIAESRAEIDAAKLLILRAAEQLETLGGSGARDSIGLVKFHAADVLSRVLDRAIQVHGALGVTDDTPLAYFYRHERAAHIYDGADEVHKVAVAKRILKSYRAGAADHARDGRSNVMSQGGTDRSARIDEARDKVRKGEEIDVDRLAAFLRRVLPELTGDVSVGQFPGGHSNLTYLVRVGESELVLRRPPFGNRVKTAHDMGREYRILSRLSAAFPVAPHALAHCEDDSVLGAPFYVMRRCRGIVLRGRTLPGGMVMTPDAIRRLGEAFTDTLADLHKVDVAAAGLADLGKPAGYVERQVRGWIKRYSDAKTDEIPEMVEVAEWLEGELAGGLPESAPALIHNDYKFDNLVLDPNDPEKVVGVLDWEMATYGEPLMDLGTAIAYWTEASDPDEVKMLPFGPTMLDGSLTRRDLVARWAERTGRTPARLDFFHAFAHFKTAVVAQQIYWRFKNGHTTDQRFASFIHAVGILGRAAIRARSAL